MAARGPSRSPAPAGSESVRKNRQLWQSVSDAYERRHATGLAADGGAAWGLWRVAESELDLLGPVKGARILELGCGAARWSVGLRRHGAKPVGLDVSSAHLRHAVAEMGAAGVRFPVLVADAEHLPLRDASFDVVFCDWGAMSFADPYRTVPEAARVLRPGGIFAFATASPLRFVFHDPRTDRTGGRLRRSYFGIHRIEFATEVDYTLPYGEWIRLFRENGLAIERLVETRGGVDRPTSYLNRAERRWSDRFPMEVIWGLRKSPSGAIRAAGSKSKALGRRRPGRRHG